MISLCPNCGYKLNNDLLDGVTQCCHCNRVFSNNLFNELLSAAWDARKNNLTPDLIQWQTKLDKDFSQFVYYFVVVLDYSHDEFIGLIKKFQITSRP